MATPYDVLPTCELNRRPPRPANLTGEVQALRALARHLFDPFPAMLEELARIALELCETDSAGLSLLDTSGHGAPILRLAAIRGLLADYAGRMASSDPGPCHVCLNRRTPQLFLHPARHFAPFRDIDPPVVELLVVPLAAEDSLLGLLWIASHSASRLFDREDVRLLESLGQCAAPAILARGSESVAGRAGARPEEPESHRMKLALTAGKLGTWEVDLIDGYSYWDEELRRLYGLPPDCRRMTIEETNALVHPRDRERVAAAFAASLAGSRPFAVEFRIVPDDRTGAETTERWVACHGEILRAPDGTPSRVIGVTQDISERKQLETELRHSEEWLRTVLDHLPVGVFYTDSGGKILYANPVARTIWGDIRFVSPDDYGEYKAWRRDTGAPLRAQDWPGARALACETVLGEMVEIESFDGVRRIIQMAAAPVCDEAKQVLGVVLIIEDITERERLVERERQARRDTECTVAELAEAHALLDTLFAKAPVGLSFWDRELRFVRVNERLAEINGLPVEAHIGKTPAELFPGIVDIEDIMARWRRILATGDPWLDVEVKGETPAVPGHIRYWNENFFPVRVGREIVGIGAVVEEITTKKQAEAEIRQLNESLSKRVGELQTLLDVAPISLGIAEDPECRRIAINAAFARLVNMPQDINASMNAPPDELPPWRVVHEGREVPAEELPMQQAAATGRPVAGRDIEFVFPDGRQLKLLSYAAPLFDPHGKVRGAIGAFLDVTGQRRLEAELKRRTTQLQAINRRKDEFLATLAHELRNPLAPIRNAVHILRLKGPADPTVEWAREVIVRQLNHLVHLVDDLLDVSRITRGKIVLDKKPVPLALLIERAREASLPLIESRKQRLEIGAPLPEATLDGDKIRLVQILTNLLNNAAKYSDEGARIWLFAEVLGAEVAVHVKDEGMGMGPDLLPMVFDLFTQGERGLDRAQGGLGIGLSLVRSLVEMHGGRVAAFSEGEGRGSEFVVWLPRCTKNVPAREEDG
jgi:PAS domain S-box-containing protein